MANNFSKASIDALYSELFDDDCSEEYPAEYLQLCPASVKLKHGPTPPIPGLKLLHSYLSAKQQEHYLRLIDLDKTIMLTPESNQAMRFGTLPTWALELASTLPSQCFPDEIHQRQPLFDQIIVNLYEPGQGISAHIDLLRFEDGIAIVSFGGPVVMQLASDCDRHEQVLLQAGDVLLMSGEARYQWKHGIDAVQEEDYQGQRVVRRRRLSITFRRLKPDIQLLEEA